MSAPIVNAMTIDVEDWFHILEVEDAPSIAEWSKLPSCVGRNVDRLLHLLEETDTRATCFVLGWVAERYPDLVRRIAEAGHEIASHGYAHGLVNELGPDRFRDDVQRSIELIEKAAGVRPAGYRAPGFSITAATPWALEVLSDLGMAYDASVFPANSGHGGIAGSERLPHRLSLPAGGTLTEFPVSVTDVLGKRIGYCGGGYLRLFPHRFVRARIARANAREEPVLVYVHPRDIDPHHPRIRMPLKRRFKSYVNLSTTYEKLRRLLDEFRFGTISQALSAVTDLPVLRFPAAG